MLWRRFGLGDCPFVPMTVDGGTDIFVSSNRPTLYTAIQPASSSSSSGKKGSVVMYSGEDDFRTQILFVVWIMYVAIQPIFSLSVDTDGHEAYCLQARASLHADRGSCSVKPAYTLMHLGMRRAVP